MADTTRLVHDAEGFNSAIPPEALMTHAITPAGDFFTRSHASTPVIDGGSWRLVLDGLVTRPTVLSLEQIVERFEPRQVDATLMCAGLRRNELLRVAPLPGELPWGSEALSTGTWSGVRLADLLDEIGVDASARYVEFTGLDTVERDGRRFGFGGSIDLVKAMHGEVLLATHLNGAPLPQRHGFPMRAVVPGWYGARSVKWLGRITLRTEPSDNYFQTHAYRVQREIRNNDPRDVSAGVPLSELPLNAVIAGPADASDVRAGTVRISGWAIGGGGSPLTGVELSLDGGNRWFPASIVASSGRWAWSLWEQQVELAPGLHEVVVRASDAAGHRQPVTLAEAWNVKGYANNAWHRVRVTAR